MRNLIALLLLAVATGCGTVVKESALDATKRPATANVAVFREGTKPERHYRELGELSSVGFADEEFKARAEFIKHAQAMGADAIVTLPTRDMGYHFNLFGRSDTQFLYKVVAVAYE
jgi:hypothetical protein